MKEAPQALFIVDPKTEHIAVLEARRLNIPVFALVDTNCDPDDADYVIPANDDAIRSVKLIVATMANAVVEANGGTPVEIVFTDEPAVEEPRGRRERNNKDRRPRENRPYRVKKEFKKEEKPAEKVEEAAKVEEAPAAQAE
jgi:small subunit ribosomal protein S2